MDKLKVAVIIEVNCLPTEGGGYTYYQSLVKEIDKYPFSDEVEIVHLLPASAKNGFPFEKKAITIEQGLFDRSRIAFLRNLYKLVHWLFKNKAHRGLDTVMRWMSRIENRTAVQTMRRNNIELAYYLKPNEYPVDFPMITTHWDVGHKSMYPFPEVAARGNYEKREYYYTQILDKSMLILCESDAGARELKYYYSVNPDKIKVLPTFGGEVIHITQSDTEQESILKKFGLKRKNFFLYPAQFWAHKNHFTLVKAFKLFLESQSQADIQLVLCGGDQGNMKYIADAIEFFGLKNNIRITGFVDNRVLHSFYRNAIALIMPTYLGPTNLPLIEAAMLNCAVACSDMTGHREILGANALYFNPSKADEIASCMHTLMNENTNTDLTGNAGDHIRNSPFHVGKSIRALEKLLIEIKPVRKAWRGLPGIMSILSYANIGTFESLTFY